MVATILVRRIRPKVSVRRGPASRTASIGARVLGPSRPMPRVGARARIAHFGGGFEPGTRGRRARGGPAPGGAWRGWGGARVRAQPRHRPVRLGRQRAADRGWSCSSDPRLTGSRRLHVGEVLRAVLAQHLPHPRALLSRGDPQAGEQLALARRSARRRSPSARRGARTAAPPPAARRPRGSPPRSHRRGRASRRTRAGSPAVSEPRRVSTLPSASV